MVKLAFININIKVIKTKLKKWFFCFKLNSKFFSKVIYKILKILFRVILNKTLSINKKKV